MTKDSHNNDQVEMFIENNLPIRTLGIECEREGKGLYPPLNRLHVWFARRPLIAARAAVVSSVVADEEMTAEEFLDYLQIGEDTIEKYKTVDNRPSGQPVYEHYGYRRPFKSSPSDDQISELHGKIRKSWDGDLPTVFDATAGGGAIPFESTRYKLPTIANELNPVASVLLAGGLDIPISYPDIKEDVNEWGNEINRIARKELDEYFPNESPGQEPATYLWAHTIQCPDCGLKLPLSPNWWLEKDSRNKGKAVKPHIQDGELEFEFVELTGEEDYNPSNGTVSYGKGECVNCDITIEGDEIKNQAQDGGFDFTLFAVEYRDERSGNRGSFRAPNSSDKEAFENARAEITSNPDISAFLNKEIPPGAKTNEPRRYGMTKWRELFNPRQLLSHYEYIQAFRQVKPKIREKYNKEKSDAILTYLCFVADKMLDYNSRMCVWHSSRGVVGNTFDRHDYGFTWSFSESNLTARGSGYEWALDSVLDVYEELVEFSGHLEHSDAGKILNEDARSLSISDGDVNAVVMDPPYYDNIMYSELADFFYVWMNEYLSDVYPDFFVDNLTDKQDEAVANPSQFAELEGEKSKSELARIDYENKMSEIFSETHRVLSEDGILTLMFTHKRTEAWDTLTKALMRAGFTIHASHPINTENPRSLHQSGKNSASSTIFLVGRKKLEGDASPSLWNDIKKETKEAARQRAQQLDQDEVEFSKVDLMLAAFGPTLEVFTKNSPVVDSEGEEVEPQTALDEARSAVREYLIDQYLNEGVKNTDNRTEWYVLAWLIFEAEQFPYDEARRLAIGVGENIDNMKKNHKMWRKKGGDILLRSHDDRVQDLTKKKEQRSGRKPVDPESISFNSDIDKVHAAIHVMDVKGDSVTWNWLNDRNIDADPGFKATVEALLRVMPTTYSDWETLRDLTIGETGELLNLDLDSSIFNDDEEVESQKSISDY